MLSRYLKKQGFIVLDGALATELEYRGADLNDPLWSAKVLLENPDLIRAVHEAYLVAGADVITSSGYQATFEGLAQRGYSKMESTKIMKRSVALALEARRQFWRVAAHHQGRLYPLVAASVGPYGAYLADGSEYRGDYGLSVKELMEWHRPRISVLLNSGADLLACETIPCMAEAIALMRLLEEKPAARAWMSFSCKDEAHLCDGTPIVEAVDKVNDYRQVSAVGVNCTPPQLLSSLLRSAAQHTTKPLLVYPNRGELWDADNHCWIPSGEEVSFSDYAVQWYRAGVRLIGGCCRTRPADIRHIRCVLHDITQKKE